MGVTGLLPLLKDASRPCHIGDFKGSTAAVDGYCWLHRGAFSCAEKLVLGERTDMHINFCMKMIRTLQTHGVKPVVVFDGKSLPSKAETNKKRSEAKKENLVKAKMLFAEGKSVEAKQLMKRCVNVTPEMAHQFIVELRKNRIDYVVAPYEADAQLTFLNLNLYVDLIISEDSDLLLFGCERVLYKMDINGHGVLVEKSKIPNCLGSSGTTQFTHDKFRWACILSGCDYLESLPGIGLKKTLKFLKPTSNTDPYSLLKKMPVYLKMPSLTVSEDYIDRFVKADNTFLYQLVFCPETRSLRPLHPYPEGIQGEDMPYAGVYFDNAFEVALGNLHLKTNQPMGERYYPKDGILIHRKKSSKPAFGGFSHNIPSKKLQQQQAAIEIIDDEQIKQKDQEMAAQVIQLYAQTEPPPVDDKPKCEKRRSFLENLQDEEATQNAEKSTLKKPLTQPTAKLDKIVSRFFVSNLAPQTQMIPVKRKASSQEKAPAKRQVSLRELFKTQ